MHLLGNQPCVSKRLLSAYSKAGSFLSTWDTVMGGGEKGKQKQKQKQNPILMKFTLQEGEIDKNN